MLRVTSSEEEPKVGGYLAVFRPLGWASGQVYCLDGREWLGDPFVARFVADGVETRLLGEEHHSCDLFLHQLRVVLPLL